jgi:uncharacterized protein (TIGR03435 family)
MRTTLVGLVFAACIVGLRAQEPAELAFEAASVRPTFSPADLARAAARDPPEASLPTLTVDFDVRLYPGGRLAAKANLRSLLAWAYDIEERQVVGGPRWVDVEYFDVTARTDRDATPAEVREMLKALLTYRFGLQTHSATSPAPLLVIDVAEGPLPD